MSNPLSPQSAFFDAFAHSPTASTSASMLTDDTAPKDLEQYFHFEEFSSGASEAQSPVTPSHTTTPLVDILSTEPQSPAPHPFLSSFFNATPKLKEEPPTHTAIDFTMDFPLPDPLLGAGEDASASAVAPAPLSVPSTNTPNMNIDLSIFGDNERRAIVKLLADFSAGETRPTQTIEPSMLQQQQPASPAPAAPPAPSVADEDEPLMSVHDRVRRASSVASTSASDAKMEMDWQQLALKPLPPMFGGEKGKGGKKGGGLSSVVRMTDEDIDDEDSWRPSPEEYKKLSSKEKRQLRNKLSARAFRTRRKDYIGTLESHIKDRDHIIDMIRTELTSTKTENQDLRKELEALKQSTMNILGNVPTPAPPAPVRRTSTPRFPLNTRKDLPATLASVEASRGFWGGSGSDNMFAGGRTTCHTLLTPDLVLPNERNLNPLLNSPEPPIERYSLQQPANGRDLSSAPFRQWAEETPFTLRSMDAYRMQIWGRLAREAAAEKAGVSLDARPKFFTEAKQSAAIAEAATETITTKLAQAFWAAFQGPQGTDHMADVVTGKAKLAVVDVKEKDEDGLAQAFGGLKLASATQGHRENPLKTMSSFLSHAAGVHA